MKHVKNVEAFSRLVDFCTGYGGTYNPGSQTLQLASLTIQLQEARKSLEHVMVTKSLFDNEVSQRKQVFDQLPRLAASILRTLEASGASLEKRKDAQAFAHLMMGVSPKNRAPVESEAAQQTPAQRAKLQLAYVSKAESFTKLVQAVATEPLYHPNEGMLSISGLTDKVKELEQLNGKVSASRVLWSNARIGRNTVMYRQSVSLYKTAKAVKKYVRAIYGHDSEQYAQVKALSFTIPGKS